MLIACCVDAGATGATAGDESGTFDQAAQHPNVAVSVILAPTSHSPFRATPDLILNMQGAPGTVWGRFLSLFGI